MKTLILYTRLYLILYRTYRSYIYETPDERSNSCRKIRYKKKIFSNKNTPTWVFHVFDFSRIKIFFAKILYQQIMHATEVIQEALPARGTFQEVVNLTLESGFPGTSMFLDTVTTFPSAITTGPQQ
ncbi:hypothetical protein PUN28_003328 [Cardiocondyla obscurior]|uniref:Uncharacterized protein n=1 Tax=Cardiocondyla obscurior TaxID=286306 RepID=A0AAW2GKI2_9HYME